VLFIYGGNVSKLLYLYKIPRWKIRNEVRYRTKIITREYQDRPVYINLFHLTGRYIAEQLLESNIPYIAIASCMKEVDGLKSKRDKDQYNRLRKRAISVINVDRYPLMAPFPALLAPVKTIIVPDDYPTIQGAIDAADAGDTVFVKNLMGRMEVKKESPTSGDNTVEIQLAMVKYFFPEAKLVAVRSPLSLKAETLGKEVAEIAKKKASYDRRQTALKWTLVTSFGYLGYRNARFGRIEAHEAVTAFGREKLLQAKEICEEEGFELLHAITDSLWIRKKGFREEEVLELCQKISEATGITMSLEGIYRWMAFLPSKGNPESPVANRYFGLFKNGKIKARGLAFRRSDIPPLIQEAQLRMLEVAAKAKDMDDYRSRVPEVLDLLRRDGAVGRRLDEAFLFEYPERVPDFVLRVLEHLREPDDGGYQARASDQPGDHRRDHQAGQALRHRDPVHLAPDRRGLAVGLPCLALDFPQF
jgi:hypothetical protein